MKKLFILIIICFLFFACDNPFMLSLDNLQIDEGYGRVSIYFYSGQSRTVFPSKDIFTYSYIFTKGSDVITDMEPDADGFFTLETGNWKVDVHAHIDGVLVATGSQDFIVSYNVSSIVNVTLTAWNETGYGKFSYSILYPQDAILNITMLRLPELEESVDLISVETITEENKLATKTIIDVPAGFYLLTVQLYKEGTGWHTGLSRAVHIYDMMTTEYGTTTQPVVFTNEDFNPTTINISTIQGIVSPVAGEIPVSTITETNQFTGTVTWSPNDSTFVADTNYTATINLAPNDGYTLQGVPENYFNVAEALNVSNSAGSGEIKLLFGYNNFIVRNIEEYNAVLTVIRNGGNNQAYSIEINGNITGITPLIVRHGYNDTSFGTGYNIKILITGSGILNTSDSNGSMFRLRNGQTLIIDGNLTLNGRKNGENGHTGNNDISVVYIPEEAIFIMRGNTIVTGNNCSSTTSGGGVVVWGGIFIMQDNASVSGNTCTINNINNNSGGGVSVWDGGIFTMQDCSTVSGNTSTGGDNSAGGVRVGGGIFTIQDNATVSGNTGYGVSVSNYYYTINNLSYGIFIMEGGTVYGNQASGVPIEFANTSALRVQVDNSYMNDDQWFIGYYGIARYGDGSLILPHTDGQSYYTNNTVIGGNGNGINLSGSGTESNPWLVSNSDEWNQAKRNIIHTEGCYFIRIIDDFETNGTTISTFGKTFNGKQLEVTINGDKKVSLASGLTGSLLFIDENQSVIIQDIDLEGHNTNINSLVSVANNGSFTMQGSASVTGNRSSTGSSGGVSVSGIFNMKDSAKVAGNTRTGLGGGLAGGVSINSTVIFIMQDSTMVSENNDMGSTVGTGGVIVYGTFIMQGMASVSGNGSNNGYGGVSVMLSQSSSGTFIMQDNTVVSRNTGINSGGVYIDFGSSFIMEGGTVYGSQTSGVPVELANTVSSLSVGAALLNNGSAKYGNDDDILPHTDGNNNYTNNTITGIITLNGSGTEQYPWFVSNSNEWNTALTYIKNGGNGTVSTPKTYTISINGNIGVNGSLSSLGDITNVKVTLNGNGKLFLISRGTLLNIGSGQTVCIDSDDLILQGLTEGKNGSTLNNNSPLIFVNGGILELWEGTICDNTNLGGSSYRGGGVSVYIGGSFIMTGGTIRNNDSNAGGGVCLDSYIIGVNPSTVPNTNFTMSGGSIRDNTAGGGGGVYIQGINTNFTMSGNAIISNNVADGSGGGIYMTWTNFTMIGGTISGNSCGKPDEYGGGNGGGVCYSRDVIYGVVYGNFNKTGGIINGNNAANINDRNSIIANNYGHAIVFHELIQNNIGYEWRGYYRNTTFGNNDNVNITTTYGQTPSGFIHYYTNTTPY